MVTFLLLVVPSKVATHAHGSGIWVPACADTGSAGATAGATELGSAEKDVPAVV